MSRARELLASLPPTDPDKTCEEFDLWLQAYGLGATNIVTVNKRVLHMVNFGEWRGVPCPVSKLFMCARRVGSLDIKRCRLGRSDALIVPGAELILGHVVIEIP